MDLTTTTGANNGNSIGGGPSDQLLSKQFCGLFPVQYFSKLLPKREESEVVRSAVEHLCLSSKPGTLIIYGPDGVGKSSLVAQALLSDSGSLPKHCGLAAVLWLNVLKLSSAPKFDESAFISQLVQLLRQASCLSHQKIDFNLEFIQRSLSISGKLVLVVLDDVVNPYPVQCLVRLGPNVRCLAIARCNISQVLPPDTPYYNVQSFDVSPLCPKIIESMLLRCQTIQKFIGETRLGELVRLCHGMPALAVLISKQFNDLSMTEQVDIVYQNMMLGIGAEKKPTDVVMFLLSFQPAELRSDLFTFLLYQPGECVFFEDLVVLWLADNSIESVNLATKRCQNLVNSGFLQKTSSTTFALHPFLHEAVQKSALKRRYLDARNLETLKCKIIEKALENKRFLFAAISSKRQILFEILSKELKNYALLAKQCLVLDEMTGQSPLQALLHQYWFEHEQTPAERNMTVEIFSNLAETAAVQLYGQFCSIFMQKDSTSNLSMYNLLKRHTKLRDEICLQSAREGCSHLLRALFELRSVDVEAADAKTGDNAVMLAASKGFAGLVKYLLEVGQFDINARNLRGETALLKTIKTSTDCYKCHQVCKELLKIKQLDPNLPDFVQGSTPLTAAADKGFAPIVALLLDAKNHCQADVDLCDKSGQSALVAAIQAGHWETAGLLVDHGAQLDPISRSFLVRSDEEYFRLLAKIDRLAKDGSGDSKLARLILQGRSVEATELIIAGVCLGHLDETENSALILASLIGLHELVDLIIKTEGSKNVNFQNKFGDTAAIYAAKEGHLAIIKKLKESGANFEIGNKAGCTPLIIASASGHTQIVDFLLQSNVSQCPSDSFGMSALSYACKNGHFKTFKLLANHEEAKIMLEKADNAGVTPLMIASQAEIVQCLIDLGANLEASDLLGNTALLLAAQSGNLEVVKKLIETESNLATATNQRGDSVLHLASSNGHSETVDYLLKYDDDDELLCLLPEKPNRQGNTPLHLASWFGHLDVVELLVKAGTNLELVNHFGYSALDVASLRGHLHVVAYLICSGAIYYGGVPMNPCQHAPIHLAARKGHANVVKMLVQLGAKIDQSDRFGNTALMLVSISGHLETVRTLIEAKCDLNALNNVGNSALIAACMHGQGDVAEMLVEAGANPRLKNEAGWSALIISERNPGLNGVAKRLQRYRRGFFVVKKRQRAANGEIVNKATSNSVVGYPLPDILYAALSFLNATMNAK